MMAFSAKQIPNRAGAFWLTVLSACFLAGSVLSTASVCLADGQLADRISASAYAFISRAVAGDQAVLLPVTLAFAVIPVLAFGSGFSVFGGVFCGLLCLAQGFLLSFYSAVFLRLHGLAGLWTSVLFFGIPALLLMPALLLLASGSGAASCSLARLSWGRTGTVSFPLYGKAFWLIPGAALLMVTLASLYLLFLALPLWQSLIY